MTSASQTPPDQPPAGSPAALARQLRVFKLLAALLAAALVAGAGAYLYVRHQGQPVTILLDGKPVATVRNAAAANALISTAEKAKVGAAFAEETLVRLQKVSLVPAAPGASQDADETVQTKLVKLLKLRVPAYVVFADKQPTLAFPTSDDADAALTRVKDHWAQMPPSAPPVGEVEIVQKISIEKHTVDTRLLRSDPAAAAPYYWTPPPSRTYTVHSGDFGSRIAYRNHLSLGDFIRANPGLNVNRLKPGDTVNIQKIPVLLTVRVRKKIETTEKIHPNAPDYAAGMQQVTYLVTYLNGVEQSRDAESVIILQKPQTALSL